MAYGHIYFVLCITYMALKITSINVRGIKSEKFRYEKVNSLKQVKSDIICAQELRLTTQSDLENVRDLWTEGTSALSIGEDRADGVGVFFRGTAEIIKCREIIPGRILMIDCLYKNWKLRVINVYTPPDRAGKMKIFNKIYELLGVGFNIFLCGDFNTITDIKDRVPVKNMQLTREGKLLKSVCETCEMKDSFREKYPNAVGFTRISRDVKTRIDRIYVNSSSKIRITNYKIEYLVESDHLGVTVKFQMGDEQQRGYWKLNTQCLKQCDFLIGVAQEVQRIKSLRILTKSEVEWWNVLKEQIKIYFKYKCKELNQQRNDFYTDLMKEYVELKTKDRGIDEENRFFEIKSQLRTLNSEVFLNVQILAGCDPKFNGKAHDVIKRLNKRRENKTIFGIRNEKGDIIENEQDKREAIRQKCQSDYKTVQIDKDKLLDFLSSCPTLKCEDVQKLEESIKKEEVIKAINELSEGKCPGPDGLPAEFYKAFPEITASILIHVYNEGLENGVLHDSFYHSVISLIFKKGDQSDLDNWRQISLLNTDYKILAKVLVSRITEAMHKIIETEQTCAIKGRYMWDNLCAMRDVILTRKDGEFYIVGLDQKKAFDYVSREYLWVVLEHYGFPVKFISMIKLLYQKSKVQINVNGILTKDFEIHRGVKQGCPLSAALYVIAISPLLYKIKNETKLQGIRLSTDKILKVSAYADDVTVFIRNQTELEIINEYFNTYEAVAGAKLNSNKSEAIWIGETDPTPIKITVRKEIKILGLRIVNARCSETNWEKKEEEIKNEIENWKMLDYKGKIQVIKTFVLSKLLFLATIFPPDEKCIIRLNKICVRFIWGTNREVTKREILYKPKEKGGLGAVELGRKLKIAFCKNVAQAIFRKAEWIGDESTWKKTKGKARRFLPYFKLLYGDFVTNYKALNIDWKDSPNKTIYKIIQTHDYGEMFNYKFLTPTECQTCVQNIISKDLSEKIRDVMFLVSVGRLPVRCVVKWSCFVKTKKCPVYRCDEDETIEHLLIHCTRSADIWKRLKGIGLDFDVNVKSVMFGIFNEPLVKNVAGFFWYIICMVNTKIWKTRCKIVIEQREITADIVFKQILCELKRRKTIDSRGIKKFPWIMLNL